VEEKNRTDDVFCLINPQNKSKKETENLTMDSVIYSWDVSSMNNSERERERKGRERKD
jgi:hypothetical protein